MSEGFLPTGMKSGMGELQPQHTMVMIIRCMPYFGVTLAIQLNGCAANRRTSKKMDLDWVYTKDTCDYEVFWHGLGHPLSMSACAAVEGAAGCTTGTSARGS